MLGGGLISQALSSGDRVLGQGLISSAMCTKLTEEIVGYGRLVIQLLTYRYYDLDSNQYYGNPTSAYGDGDSCLGAIVVINSKGDVVYNTRTKDSDKYPEFYEYMITISNLPFGKYRVKLIRSTKCEPDTDWHEIKFTKDGQAVNLIFPWQDDSVYITEYKWDSNASPAFIYPYYEYLDKNNKFPILNTTESAQWKGRTRLNFYNGLKNIKLVDSTFSYTYPISEFDFFDAFTTSEPLNNRTTYSGTKCLRSIYDGSTVVILNIECREPIFAQIDSTSDKLKYPAYFSEYAPYNLVWGSIYTGIKEIPNDGKAYTTARPITIEYTSSQYGDNVIQGYVSGPSTNSNFTDGNIVSDIEKIIENEENYNKGFVRDYNYGWILTQYNMRPGIENVYKDYSTLDFYNSDLNSLANIQANGIETVRSFPIGLLTTKLANAIKNNNKYQYYNVGFRYCEGKIYYSNKVVIHRPNRYGQLDYQSTTYERIGITKYSHDYDMYDPNN